ncbi:LysM domain protein [Candidatus Rhodobacter oscarellae]|uniref:LysM domain protein n=1 Tax=Candidatus Rhodobacter oscarellae TaxID=1675527 RepID=A0A0J9EC04_9RHOB|nr:transporter substrate-binding domain-containing protein [Candidatus Rhodobacter lobularis]KMW60310.1 LysM domain protein [Candidatus Rhodobacter lobularis]
MRNLLAAAAVALTGLGAAGASAETCGGEYVVARGDTLSGIANRHYENAGKWTAIHNNNLKTIGPKPNLLRIGMKLKLACLDGLPTGLPGGTAITDVTLTSAPVQVQPGHASVRQKINLLTGNDYAPFTDQALHNGGMLTDVVNAAFAEAAPKQGYAIHWVNDWTAHFEPLLSNALLDLSFPWRQPDCATMGEDYRCQNLLFSDPMFEMLQLLFTASNNPMVFNRDADMVGKTLCRPVGYTYTDMDQDGRNWLKEGKITLLKPRSVKDCFDKVLSGEADAVAINEFTGRDAIKEHGLQDQIRILPQPLAVAGLHVVVHKSHPQAQEMLAMANEGLRGIRKSGDYQKIIEDHMARIYADY